MKVMRGTGQKRGRILLLLLLVEGRAVVGLLTLSHSRFNFYITPPYRKKVIQQLFFINVVQLDLFCVQRKYEFSFCFFVF